MGIDSGRPVFSWKLRGKGFQRNYRIWVATSEEILNAGKGDLWDSGEVDSEEQFGIRYCGKPLSDQTEYYWRVTINGETEGHSKFETAFLGEAMRGSVWIGMPLAFAGATDLARLEFFPEKPVKRARFYVAALGCARCMLNGKLIADTYFDGAISVYRKCVYYRTHALEGVRLGKNVLCVELGYGFYGAKKLIGQVFLEYEDGSVCRIPTFAGRGWNMTKGAVIANSVYGGEVCDGRRLRDWSKPDTDMNTSEFTAAYCADPPAGRLTSCPIPPMRVAERFAPLSFRCEGNRVTVDAGVNVTGWLRLRLKGKRGGRATVRYAEVLGEDGKLNCANLRAAENQDAYILAGEGEENWAPGFTYHGFRYAEIELKDAELLSAEVEHVRTAISPVGTFSCSDETMNRLHEIAFRTESNNLNGIFTDCPQRDERLGWLNDMTARIFQSICNFDLSSFLPNFVDMITQSQNGEGEFGDTVPFYVGSSLADPVSAYHLLGLLCYRFYGNRDVLVRNYGGFRKWLNRLRKLEKDGVVDWGIYGDWCPAKPFAKQKEDTHSAFVSPQFMSAAYYYWYLRMMREIAEIVGEKKDALDYAEEAESYREAFYKKYYDAEQGVFGGGSQTECAVAMTLFPENRALWERLAARTVQDLRGREYHTTCGNQGYRHLFYRLAEAGYSGDLVKLLKNPAYPGWGYMLGKGATTVWERWEADVGSDMHSFNHPMFGSYDGFFYNYLAGIRTAECANAFGEIVVAPCFAEGVSWVRAVLETVRGEIRVFWERTETGVRLKVSTPANTRLKVRADGFLLLCGEQECLDEMRLGNGDFTLHMEMTGFRPEGE